MGPIVSYGDLVGDSIPPDIPPVIEDAITVVKQLGFKYLWVDRYCIQQDAAVEKQIQIWHMDSTYRNSALTIIAATGDATLGLPGVRNTPRLCQPSLRLEDRLLFAIPPSPKKVILGSKWNTRAWTYQEGLLSRKRLVFTKYEVYFQCMNMDCRESTVTPLKPLHMNSFERALLSFASSRPKVLVFRNKTS